MDCFRYFKTHEKRQREACSGEVSWTDHWGWMGWHNSVTLMAVEGISGLQASTRFDYHCLQQWTGTWVCIKPGLPQQTMKVFSKTEREAQIQKSELPLCCISLATRMENQQGKAEGPSNAKLSRTAPAEGTAASFHLCTELQQLTHPGQEFWCMLSLLITAEPSLCSIYPKTNLIYFTAKASL